MHSTKLIKLPTITMNAPLHYYLVSIVGNVEQLIITADNAKIPIDHVNLDHSVCGDEMSIHSNYTHYSRGSGCSYGSMGSSSIGSSSSRWDSEASPSVESKERRPRLPPRRSNSGSPPASPTGATSRVKEMSEDVVDCCRRASSSSSDSTDSPMSLTSATNMLRMPRRSASITKTSRRRPSKGTSRHPNPARHADAKEDGRREKQNSSNVSKILGEAIRELGLTEDELAACGDPSLSLQYLKPKASQ